MNGDENSLTGLINSPPSPPKDKESSKLNEMNMSVKNGDVNGDYCYMNISTGSVINNQNSIDYANKRDEISTNIYLRGKNGLPDGVEIDDLLPASTLNQYVNTEYNN